VGERELLRRTAEIAADFLESLEGRLVFPVVSADELRATLGGPLPAEPSAALDVVEQLARDADQGLVASQGGRYFGFVTGSSLPAALGSDWLTSTWDQNLAFSVMSPAAAVLEETAGRWAAELLGVPVSASFAFVTGTQMAHVTCLAAARHDVLARAGWNLAEKGLAGAPPITVVGGAQHHVTVDRALRYLGIGSSQIVAVDADDQGRIDPDALAAALESLEPPLVVCTQAGEVNTGASDPFEAVVGRAHEAGAWVHVDGAFGLWAAASPRYRHLVAGHGAADSWSVDAHKWLNVPYDCGIAFCAHPESHRAAMSMQAAYLEGSPAGALRDPADWTPDSSRRARSIPVYAAIRELGSSGVAELVERCCALARELAAGLERLHGCEIVNDVVLNQVLVGFDDDAVATAVLDELQGGGEAWMGGTTWKGRPAIRVSVSGWRTTSDDIARTVDAFGRAIAATEKATPAA
jgi:glutamate/tyrosine decarboxylase-like PLP-dependent enzyme